MILSPVMSQLTGFFKAAVRITAVGTRISVYLEYALFAFRFISLYCLHINYFILSQIYVEILRIPGKGKVLPALH
jgi:uncharacterized membrane protein